MKTPVLLESLSEVSAQMDALIAKEKLPSLIRPDYLADAVTAYPLRGGKRLRPALAMWFCGAVAGNPEQAARVGLAVELYHNWTLIHDDIIDDDALRRGGQTCHVMLEQSEPAQRMVDTEVRRKFGRDMAILAGDILHGWSLNLLGRAVRDGVAPEVVTALLSRLTGWVTPELISGEALDVDYAHRSDLEIDAVETMLVMKTGILLQFAAEAGVMIGKSTSAWEDPLVRQASTFAARAGLAFQLQDDILGMFGDEKRLGKPICSDLIEGKRTVLLLKAMNNAAADQRKILERLLAAPELSESDIAAARQIIVDTGALAWTRERAVGLARDAHRCLDAFDDSEYRELLSQWVEFLVNRDV